ncbi:MAG: DUF4912 domain-containing protein [Sphaerochaeta sp.]
MILINIDSLSTNELQHIAQMEGLADWNALDREQLISALEDWFEEMDEGALPETNGQVSYARYTNSLTNHRGKAVHFNDLPRTNELPPSYYDSTIHLLLRDPQWAYAYWSLPETIQGNKTSFDDEDHSNESYFLRLYQNNLATGEETSSDIAVEVKDQEWNIHLTAMGSSYAVELCRLYSDGSEEVIARSASVETYLPYWADRIEELAMDNDLFLLHFSSLVTKTGEVAENLVLKDLVSTVSKGVLG